MSEIGIIKEIDGVGRVVIPKELRERYGLSGDVEVVATENGVLTNCVGLASVEARP